MQRQSVDVVLVLGAVVVVVAGALGGCGWAVGKWALRRVRNRSAAATPVPLKPKTQ